MIFRRTGGIKGVFTREGGLSFSHIGKKYSRVAKFFKVTPNKKITLDVLSAWETMIETILRVKFKDKD